MCKEKIQHRLANSIDIDGEAREDRWYIKEELDKDVLGALLLLDYYILQSTNLQYATRKLDWHNATYSRGQYLHTLNL